MRLITGDHPIWTGHGLINGGDWISAVPEAQAAHLYFSPATGRFAKAGRAVPISQMGTFARAGGAFQTQATGGLLGLDANVPRLGDYSFGSRAWLNEGPATNLVPHNVALNAVSYWTNGAGTTVSSPMPDGAGTSRAFTVSGNGFVRPNSAIAVTPGEAITVTQYVRNATGGASFRAFDVTNGTGISVQAMANGSSEWARERHTFTVPAGCFSIYVYAVYFSEASGSAQLFGLQCERGPQASSLVWTEGGAGSRAPETFNLNIAGLDFTDGVSFAFDLLPLAISASNDQFLFRMHTGGADYCDVFRPGNDIGKLRLRQASGGVTSVAQLDVDYSTAHKIGVTVGLNKAAISVDGALDQDITSPYATAYSAISLNSNSPSASSGAFAAVPIKSLTLEPALAPAAMQARTAA